MNRADASTTGGLLSSADAAKTGATTDSTRANCCLSNAPGSRRPSASNVRMENVVRTTRTGSLATSSTTTSAMRARCPAKADKQWLAGSRSIRWNLVLGSCQRVSSRAMRNFRQENPISAPPCTNFEVPQCPFPLGRLSPHIVHREHDRALCCDEGRFPAISCRSPSRSSRYLNGCSATNSRRASVVRMCLIPARRHAVLPCVRSAIALPATQDHCGGDTGKLSIVNELAKAATPSTGIGLASAYLWPASAPRIAAARILTSSPGSWRLHAGADSPPR